MQAEDYKELGNELREQGKLDEALEMYQKSIVLQPDYGPAYNNIGLIYKEKGDLITAIRYYRKGIKLGNIQAYTNLAHIMDRLGKIKQAIKISYRCLSLNPNFIGAYVNLGRALINDNNLDEAILISEQGLSLSDPNIHILEVTGLHYNLSYAYNLKNNKLKYLENLKKGIALTPGHVYDTTAYNKLAYYYCDTEQCGLGIEVAQEAITKNIANSSTYHQLGYLLWRSKRLEEALEMYQKAIALQPDYASAYNNIGLVHEKKVR